MAHVVLIDNHDSFVYNLVDAAGQTGHKVTVFRNTVEVSTVLEAKPDLLILSPGPGHPREAGNQPELIERGLGEIPMLGICLGFQALIEHFGGVVEPCGPEHGRSVAMELTDAGVAHPVFAGLALGADRTEPDVPGRLVPVARYHSLGCVDAPSELRVLARTATKLGDVAMAAETKDSTAFGVQFHPESILTPNGPRMLDRCITQLLNS